VSELGYCFLCDAVSPSEVRRRFGGNYCIHLQGRRVSQATNKKKKTEAQKFNREVLHLQNRRLIQARNQQKAQEQHDIQKRR
jgi:hypothetical protein